MGYVILGLVGLLLAVILLRAALFNPKPQKAGERAEVTFDREKAVDALQKLVRCKTISNLSQHSIMDLSNSLVWLCLHVTTISLLRPQLIVLWRFFLTVHLLTRSLLMMNILQVMRWQERELCILLKLKMKAKKKINKDI